MDADYALRSLVHRRLVVELGRSDAPGRPILYGTGVEFLERFGLTSLDDLPVVDAAVAARLTLPEADAVDAADSRDTAGALADLESRHRPGSLRLMPEERVGKLLATAGFASRRGADALIAAGRVTLDGRVAVLGEKADPARAVIALDGRPVDVVGALDAPTVHLALHKPAGFTSTVADRHALRTVLDLVPARLVAPGRAPVPGGAPRPRLRGPAPSHNDGSWTERVLHPRHGVEREYAAAFARAA